MKCTHNISYIKWSKHDRNKLYQSLRKHIGTIEPQLYIPIMSLFFYIHNTPNSHRVIDFKRNNYIKEILECYPIKDYQSNLIIKASTIIDGNSVIEELFCKVIPLLDPIHFLLNNYNISF